MINVSKFCRFLFFIILVVMFSGSAFAATILNQPPDQIESYLSDAFLSASSAENIIVSSQVVITQIKIWGTYGGGTTPAADNFTVIFHSDLSGLPGAAISTQSNVPVARTDTGETVGAFAEHEYTLTLTTPVNLSPGNYWIEIFNNTRERFGWETGTLDPVNGIDGFAFASAAPGVSWSPQEEENLAIEVTADLVQQVPTMNEYGMIVFMILAGLGAIHYLRRQRKA